MLLIKTNHKKGFTIVEMIVAIAIIAVLATVGILGFGSLIADANKSADSAVAKAITSALSSTLSDINNDTLGTQYSSKPVNDITVLDALEANGLTEADMKSKRKDYNLYYNMTTKKAEFAQALSTGMVTLMPDMIVKQLLIP